jgi:hypothetical protein
VNASGGAVRFSNAQKARKHGRAAAVEIVNVRTGSLGTNTARAMTMLVMARSVL